MMMSLSRVCVLLLCGTFAACANNPLLKKDRGIPVYDEKIASDAVTRLASLYPPAKTQFNLEALAPEGFAALLAAKLRAKGYAVSETKRAAQGIEKILPGDAFGTVFSPATNDKTPVQSRPENSTGIALRYALDYSPTEDLSRITLKVGNSLLARAYITVDGTIAPAGAWTYRE
ncbi:MAG: hypothetical protein ABJA60_10545 [Nitrosospira sp.]